MRLSVDYETKISLAELSVPAVPVDTPASAAGIRCPYGWTSRCQSPVAYECCPDAERRLQLALANNPDLRAERLEN